MNRAVLAAAAVVLTAAATGGYLASRPQSQAPLALVSAASAQAAEEPIYYRHPDGQPNYSATPVQTPDGRGYRAVMPHEDLNFDDEPAVAAAPGDRKIKFYRNPMGLADVSPVPKKDSMGMDYIPVYEDEDAGDGAVKLSAGKIQRSGVQTESAIARVIQTPIRAPGILQLDERRVSVISMRAESWVQKVANVTTGSRVVKGQPLMEIYSPVVASASAEYIATLNSKATSGEAVYGRGSRQRLMNLDVPDAAIVAMEKSRATPIAIEWTAPRDGVVLERNATEGMRAQPGDVLFRVADTSLLWAMVDIPERDIGLLALGQTVTVQARGLPGRTFNGVINLIYPQFNRDTRTVRARIELQNADLALLPDMYVDAEIESGPQHPVLTVPVSAVLDSGSRQVVLVDKSEGRFEPRAVKLGHHGSGFVEVREGLTEGERVVVSANFLIDAESNLNAALKAFAAPEPKP